MGITNRHKNKGLPSQREWQERTRQRIRDSGIVDKSIKVLSGELKLDACQIQVLKMLLPTILPTQSESSVETITPQAPDMETMRTMVQESPELQATLAALLKPEEPEDGSIRISVSH